LESLATVPHHYFICVVTCHRIDLGKEGVRGSGGRDICLCKAPTEDSCSKDGGGESKDPSLFLDEEARMGSSYLFFLCCSSFKNLEEVLTFIMVHNVFI
jgi:hypothetical protein